VILQKSEETFWKLTPREFDSLMRMHIYVNTPENKRNKWKPNAYIDQVL
jgi:hypothetical protein